jgi:hypothetical protein
LALNSIAERYSAREIHRFDSDKVLAEKDYPRHLSSRSNGQVTAIRSQPDPKRPTDSKRRFAMKQLLIVITLIVASAAPAMAEGFPNPFDSQAGR